MYWLTYNLKVQINHFISGLKFQITLQTCPKRIPNVSLRTWISKKLKKNPDYQKCVSNTYQKRICIWHYFLHMCLYVDTWTELSFCLTWAGHLTARSDVYSFGVVLLELLTGRKSVDKTRPSKEQSLVDWARPKLNDKRKLLQIIDPILENQYSVRAAQKACSLAYYCLSQNPKARPLMSDVVDTLEPLQSSSNSAKEVSLSSSSSSTIPLMVSGGSPFALGSFPEYRMHHRFAGTVGASGSGCRSPNPNCSPGGPAACRVRWEGKIHLYEYTVSVCVPLFSSVALLKTCMGAFALFCTFMYMVMVIPTPLLAIVVIDVFYIVFLLSLEIFHVKSWLYYTRACRWMPKFWFSSVFVKDWLFVVHLKLHLVNPC